MNLFPLLHRTISFEDSDGVFWRGSVSACTEAAGDEQTMVLDCPDCPLPIRFRASEIRTVWIDM